jgi:hypothetical protein
VPLFHIDQRAARDRCEAILGRVPTSDNPARAAARAELVEVLTWCRLVPGATARGVAWLLSTVQRTGDRAAARRTIERAIPVRGAVRRGRTAVAVIALAALTVAAARLSPWLAAAIAVVAAAVAARRLAVVDRAAIRVHRMEDAARAADEAGDVETVNALYAEARRMIAADRVPAGVGFRLAYVLGAAARATPFPVELLRELRQLHFLAPETELSYDAVCETIEERLRLRVGALAGRIDRGLDAGEDVAPVRAELRDLARTAPGATGARAHQVRLLRRLAAEHPDPAALLDELEELIARLEAINDRRARVRDGVPGDLATALATVASRVPLDRARTLAARAAAL